MVETELGEWRRSHYSKDLDASMEGSDVTITVSYTHLTLPTTPYV